MTRKMLSLFLLTCFQAQAQDMQKISVDGTTREYIVHVPPQLDKTKKYPLVFAFHGGGGTARNSIPFFGMNAIADTAGFIAVYPNGLNKGWNDGREVKRHTHDDIGFIHQLLQQLLIDYPIDKKKVFATGISNGGFFSFAIGLHLADQFRAIAPVCATIPKDLLETYKPTTPVSLLLINGTGDPLVPYGGGKVGGRWLNRGQCSGTEESVATYVSLHHCGKATGSALPDRDPNDGCKATRFVYSCDPGHNVQFIRVDGGGHTWPGGKQYLGKKLIGNVCRDFSAAAEVWRFFRSTAAN